MRIVFALLIALASPTAGAVELLLFGGSSHKEFLGCLNCSPYSSDSVCNAYGNHGSSYGGDSIWNAFGRFGSQFSSDSAWNQFASSPPVIVDRDGNFYGYFTANKYKSNRTRIKGLVQFLDQADAINADLDRARDAFCSN